MEDFVTLEQRCKEVLDQLDGLMIALTKQKKLGLDAAVVVALKDLTKTRNALKKDYIKTLQAKEKQQETVFTHFLDEVAKNV